MQSRAIANDSDVCDSLTQFTPGDSRHILPSPLQAMRAANHVATTCTRVVGHGGLIQIETQVSRPFGHCCGQEVPPLPSRMCLDISVYGCAGNRRRNAKSGFGNEAGFRYALLLPSYRKGRKSVSEHGTVFEAVFGIPKPGISRHWNRLSDRSVSQPKAHALQVSGVIRTSNEYAMRTSARSSSVVIRSRLRRRRRRIPKRRRTREAHFRRPSSSRGDGQPASSAAEGSAE